MLCSDGADIAWSMPCGHGSAAGPRKKRVALRYKKNRALSERSTCNDKPVTWGYAVLWRRSADIAGFRFGALKLRQNLADHFSVHVGETEMAALKFVSESRMVDAEAMQNRRV